MPNWRKVVVSGSDAALNSLSVTTNVTATSFTGSLLGTASYAAQALSSSYAVSASYAPSTNTFPYTGSAIISGSLILTGSLNLTDVSSNFSIVGNGFGQTSLLSPNGALVLTPGIYGVQINGAFPDLQVDGNITTNGYLASKAAGSYLTGSLLGTASYAAQALSSSYAFSASYATTASYAQNIIISGSINNVDYIDFNTGSAVPAWKSGRVYWDNTDGALAVYNAEQDITLQVGQENWVRVFNATGVLITNGTPVRLVGSHGDVPEVELAQSVRVSGSIERNNQILGLATHDIEINTIGYVTIEGLVKGLNTNAFSDGDRLFVSSSAGKITNIPPSAPYEVIPVGVVVKAGPGGSGIIYVSTQQPIDFSDLSSVVVSGSYHYGDLWVYRPSGSTGVWEHTNQLTGSYSVTGSWSATSFTGSLLGTSSYARQALSSSYALTASYVATASYVPTLQQVTTQGNTTNTSITSSGLYVNGNSTITGNLNVLGTASFAVVTSSVVIVGDSTIILSTNYPAVRFGGISVIDSGSFGNDSTGSLFWDSLNNKWIYSNPSGSTYDGGMLISGPRNTSGLGNEVGTTLNAVLKGQGGDHLTSSALFEDGSTFSAYDKFYVSSSGRTTLTGSLNVSAGITGSLLGTASYAAQALSSSYALSASYAPDTTFPYSGSARITGSLNIVGATTITGSLNVSAGITGSLLGTSSYASLAATASYYGGSIVSASYAATASSVNTLNQSVLITGSVTVGATSAGATENTLTLGPAPAGGAGEGGQLGLNAVGGTYTSASFIDNWQNYIRILKGTNAGSSALVTQWNLHTTQMTLPAYTSATAFVGTAVANLAVDSSGNVITVSTTGGSVFPYTGNAVITGSLTTTQAIYSQVNGAMYFRGGDDAEFWDINVANTVGIYGQQDATVGSIKLGSGGGTISGKSGRVGIGTINPVNGTLEVSGNVYATSFTGSLLGTASYAASAATASYFSGSLASPGSTTQVLYNNGGAIAGDSGLVYSGSNVGIGTTSPGYKLEVNGTQRVVGNFYLYNTVTNVASNYSNQRGLGFDASTGATEIAASTVPLQLSRFSTTGDVLTIRHSGSYVSSLKTDGGAIFTGNVGINTTAPLAILSVGAGSLADINVPIQISSEGVGTQKWIGINKNGNYGLILGYIENGGLGGNGAYIRQVASDPMFFLVNSTTVAMTMLSSGNVGIGLTSPQKILDVLSTGNDFVTVGANGISPGGWTGIHFGYRENNTLYRKSAIVFERTDLTSNNAQGKVHILNGPQAGAGSATLADTKLTINEAGYVGIGTTSPSAKLDIKGDLIVSSSLIVNQNTASLASGARTVSTNATGSYTAAFFNYTVASGSNARAGQVSAVWNGGSIQYTDVSTTDIGSTLAVAFTASLSGANVLLTTVLPTSGWTVKTLVNLI